MLLNTIKIKKQGFTAFILLLVVLFYVNPVNGQKNNALDSLKITLYSGVYGKDRVDLLNDISKRYITISIDSARVYNNEADVLSRELKYDAGLALAFLNRGVIEYYVSNYKSVQSFEDKALEIFKRIGDERNMARAYGNIALAYYAQSQYKTALEYHQKALDLRKKNNDKEGLADTYTNIGLIQYKEGAFSKALEYHLAAKTIREADPTLLSGCAVSYNHIGNIYRDQNQLDDALAYYASAKKIYEDSKDKFGIAIAYANIANIKTLTSNYNEALKLFEKALKTFEELGNKVNIAKIKNEIGAIYFTQKDYTKALKYYTDALVMRSVIQDQAGISNSYNNIGLLNTKLGKSQEALNYFTEAKKTAEASRNLAELRNAYEGLSGIYAKLGNHKLAFENHLLFSALEDSLRSITVDKQITQYIADEKRRKLDSEITQLQNDKKLKAEEAKRQEILSYSFIGGFILLLIFSIVLYSRFQLIRSQKKVIEKERQRSEDLLLNILPVSVANELKIDGKSKAKSFELVSVMFTDIKNFTSIAENLKPEELVAEIDYYFKAFDNIIGKYGLEKIKTIGDAYMCAGGLPQANTSNPKDIVNAALDIQEFMRVTKLQRESEGKLALEIRIGIHSGPIVAGIVGIKKFAYDIWGDTVNIAARMETAGETGYINISEHTYNLIKDEYYCEHRGKIEVKNKGTLDMYFVIEKKKSEQTGFDQVERFLNEMLAKELPENLYYHGLHHTKDVVAVAANMGHRAKLSRKEIELLKLGAYFHDCGFIKTYAGHEEAGVALAKDILSQFKYSQEDIEAVCRLVMVTKMPQRPANLLEEIICDADLDYLGRQDYEVIAATLFNELKEYGLINGENWVQKQIDFLEKHQFFLTELYSGREIIKQQNLSRLKSLVLK